MVLTTILRQRYIQKSRNENWIKIFDDVNNHQYMISSDGTWYIQESFNSFSSSPSKFYDSSDINITLLHHPTTSFTSSLLSTLELFSKTLSTYR